MKSRLMFWPIVKCSRIEIRATWPDDGMNLRVERDLSESLQVAEWAVKLALKNPLKINGARQTVVETQTQ